MKKILFAAFVSMVSMTNVMAQYEPKGGDFSTEISFNPFSNNFNTFDLQGAKFKGVLFLDDMNALRISVGVGFNMKTERADLSIPQKDYYQTVSEYNYQLQCYDIQKKDFNRTTNYALGLNIGYEHHFKSLKRLDLYAGVEGGIDYCYKKEYSEDNVIKSDYKDDTHYIKNTYLDTETSTSDAYALNFNIFTGANFYVYKSLYLGAELGLGAGYTIDGNVKSEYTTGNPEAQRREYSSEKDVKNNNFSLKLYCDPTLHIGWTF